MDQILSDQSAALTLQLTSSHHIGVRVFLKRTHCPLNDPNQVLVRGSEMAMISFSTESCPFEVVVMVDSDKRIRKEVITEISLCDAASGAIVDSGLRIADSSNFVSSIRFSGLKRRMQSSKFGLNRTSFVSESLIRPMRLHVAFSVDGMDNSECILQTPSFFVFSKIPTDVHLKEYVVRHLRAERAAWIPFHVDKTSKRYHQDQKRATIFLCLCKSYQLASYSLLQSLLPYTITPQQPHAHLNAQSQNSSRNETRGQNEPSPLSKRVCIRDEAHQFSFAKQTWPRAESITHVWNYRGSEEREGAPSVPMGFATSKALLLHENESISQAACNSEDYIDSHDGRNAIYATEHCYSSDGDGNDNDNYGVEADVDADADTETLICQDLRSTCGKEDADLLLSLASCSTKAITTARDKASQSAPALSYSDLVLPSFAQSFASLLESEHHDHASPNDEARSSSRSNPFIPSEKVTSSVGSTESRTCHHIPASIPSPKSFPQSLMAHDQTQHHQRAQQQQNSHQQYNPHTSLQSNTSIFVPSVINIADYTTCPRRASKASVWMKPMQISDLISPFTSQISLLAPVMIQIPHLHGVVSVTTPHHHQ